MFQQLTNQIVEAYQALELENATLKRQLEIMQRENARIVQNAKRTKRSGANTF